MLWWSLTPSMIFYLNLPQHTVTIDRPGPDTVDPKRTRSPMSELGYRGKAKYLSVRTGQMTGMVFLPAPLKLIKRYK